MTPREVVRMEKQAQPSLAFGFLRLLFVGDRKEGNAFQLATNALDGFAKDGDRFVSVSGAKEELTKAILEHYPKFIETLPTTDDGFYELRGDILEIDARLADYVEKNFGASGKDMAESIRASEPSKKVALDSMPLREWSHRWREFSQSERGMLIGEAEERHAREVIDSYRTNFGDLDIQEDPREILRWIKSNHMKSWEDLNTELLPLMKEREEFAGSTEGLSASLFSMWLGETGKISEITSIRNRGFARVVWLHVVRPGIEKAHKKPASLVRAVFADTIAFHSRGQDFDSKTKNLTFEGRRLASIIDPSIDLDVIERGLSLLGSVLSHRLLRWQVHTGHDQYMAGLPYANVLEIDGGWSALAKQLGFKEKDIPDLKKLIYAQAHFRFDFPDGSKGNLVQYNERPAMGQDRARLTITLGTPLLPSFVHGLPKRTTDRKLVPYPKEPPPLFGRPNEHGQQLTMSLAFVAELRERASELATNGTVQLTQDDWIRMADRSQLPRKLIVPVLETWESGDTRSRPFIVKEGTDRFTLSDAHLAEREFLIEAGQMEIGGKKAGLRGVQFKKKKLKVGK